MQPWKQNNRTSKDNNRINVVMAIIFLLGGGIFLKLFNLQVLNADLYVAKANSQHLVSASLDADRGRVFIEDGNSVNDNNDLYPLASNKKFALIYAVPKDVKQQQLIAENLYEVFRKAQSIKDVGYQLEKEDKDILAAKLDDLKNLPDDEKAIAEEKILKSEALLKASPDYAILRQARIDEEIKKKKEEIVGEYVTDMSKPDDPYEPLEQKVDEDKLKEFYAGILSSLSGLQVATTTMDIKNDVLYYSGPDGKKEEAKVDGIDYMMKVYRYYPEDNVGSNMLGFVSYAQDKAQGQYGLEGFFNDELTGTPGKVRTERSAAGELIIANDRQYEAPKNGSDLVLTINRAIEFEACNKLDEAVKKFSADGGSVIVMNPKTGAILAMCSNPNFNPNDYRDVKDMSYYNNEAIFSQYEPGSIFKAITMSMALDQNRVVPETTYNDTGIVKIANYEIKNSDKKAHGVVSMNVVLEQSLNTGSIFAMRKIGPDMFSEYVQSFGFGDRVGVEMEGESSGDIRSLTKEKMNKELYAATASFGQGIAVTPIQMVTAFAALANGGTLVKPYIVKEIIHNDGTKEETEPREIRRVISDRASMLIGGMLVNVVEKGHGKRAGVNGYYVAGKTGTAQVAGHGKYQDNINIGSFAGYAPVDDPVFVMLVRIDQPKGVEWAESSAAPLFGEIAGFILDYFQVPTSRPIDNKH